MFTPTIVPLWSQESEAFAAYSGFLENLGDSVKGKKLSDEVHISEVYLYSMAYISVFSCSSVLFGVAQSAPHSAISVRGGSDLLLLLPTYPSLCSTC